LNFKFQVLQGSAATQLRCGGHCTISFVANFLANTTVKEFENLPTSVEVMNEYIVAVFLTHCV